MTDHPKPIARYAPKDRSHRSIDCDTRPFMVDAENGRYMLVADHEAVLAAEREQYDARIAELERERNSAIHEETSTFSDRVDFEEALYNLRDAIEAKAQAFQEAGFEALAAELRTLKEAK